MEFEDNNYHPDFLELEKDKPYILTLVNVGGRSHDLVGEQFFSSLIIHQIKTSGFSVKSYHVESIFLRPNQKVSIWIVPIKKGEFPFICTLPGHFEDGMEGTIVIK